MPISDYLHGVHDADGANLMDRFPGWVVISEAIGHDPNDHSGDSYDDLQRRGLGVVIRLNNAHDGQNGTIPDPGLYSDFATRCANFVAASTGIDVAIIGNEPNLSDERPPGSAKIEPLDYARCYSACRTAIKAVRPGLRVLVAAIAPWNNQSGDWLDYLTTVAAHVGDCDGFALHAYTHGADPSLLHSDEKQHGWFWHFRTYQDQLLAIGVARLVDDLLFMITESDQNDPWVDTNSGWVQAAYQEIADWNRGSNMPIRLLTMYRSNKDDKWSFADKPGVQADFRAAVQHGYKAPQLSSQAQGEKIYMPKITATALANPPSSLPVPDVDPRAAGRGTSIQTVAVEPGQQYWRVKRLYTPDTDGSKKLGPDHHILANVLIDGQRQVGTPLLVTWGDGEPSDRTTIQTKKNDPFAYSADFPMSPGPFIVEVADGKPSERVVGIKMGEQTEQGFNPGIHESTLVDFELVTMPATAQPSQPVTPAQPAPAPVPQFAHPVHEPQYRVITQAFGANDAQANYQAMGLAGHDGVDFGTPVGSVIDAVDDGHVIEADTLPDYGNVIKIRHPWGESVYAHLDQFLITMGEYVSKGEQIARSGATGNAEGPHLHFGLRIFPYTRGFPYDGFSDPMPYLNAQTSPLLADNASLVEHFQDAGTEFGLPWTLIASQAWAESSFRTNATSGAGAQGLMQIMPATWAEWAPKISAGANPLDAYQNLRVGAAYMKWLLPQVKGDLQDALMAYNAGIGNVQAGQIDNATVEYCDKVIHGKDLLDAVLPMLSK